MAPNAITLLGLSLVFTNFLTLLYYNPTLACGPKPLHVSLGGSWDPLFKPSSLAGKVDVQGWLQWLGLSSKAATEVGGECAPRWLFFTFAVGLFMYQSLDAIDGK
jgi:ethanolaminephosphotransferase